MNTRVGVLNRRSLAANCYPVTCILTGVSFSIMGYMLDWESIRPDITRRYEGGESASSIAAEYGTTHQTIGTWLRRWGVIQRTASERSRKFPLREDAFDAIRDEPTAYWLGFIFADGCVTTQNRLTIALHAQDIGHLRLFAEFLGTDLPIRTYGHYAEITVTSARLCRDLEGYGVTPRKSWADFCPTVTRDLEKHFWRGVLDGDGFISSRNAGRLSMGICGSKATAEAFRSFVMRHYPNHRRNITCGKGVYIHTLGVHATKAISALLYGDATVALQRKAERVNHVLLEKA